MSRNLNNPSILHRDYGATSSSNVNAITTIPDVNFSGFSPTEFMSLSENIAVNIQSVKSSWQQLEKAYKTINKHRNATQALRDKIHNIQTQTNLKIQTTSKDLSRLTAVVRRGDKQQKLQLEKLTSDFKAIVEKYSASQQQIAILIKQLFMQAVHAQQQDEEAATGDTEALTQNQIQIQSSMQFENDLLKDREVKIREIEADVLDVNAIMRELSSLVNQQGQEIDSIENSIDHSCETVKNGTEQLLKAAEYRTRYRRKVLIILAIAVIIGLIVTGIIVGQLKS